MNIVEMREKRERKGKEENHQEKDLIYSKSGE